MFVQLNLLFAERLVRALGNYHFMPEKKQLGHWKVQNNLQHHEFKIQQLLDELQHLVRFRLLALEQLALASSTARKDVSSRLYAAVRTRLEIILV